MPKRPNPMAINKALNYSTEEAARALNVSTATIRNYVRRGLPVMTKTRPFLFTGEALREFLVQERARNKRPLQPDELFCPACKKGQRPFGLMVDLVPRNAKTAMLKGLCDVCEGPSNRIIGLRQFSSFDAIFDIAKPGSGEA
ncbi:MAG: helix-turn-helix domain-containing protein [Pseudomonadota bacterium]